MNVLVTGATGFLGFALTTELLRRGEHVRVLARDEQRTRARFDDAVEIIAGEITDSCRVEQAVNGAEIIYHLAGRLYHPAISPDIYYHTHVEGTRVLLACCREQAQLRRVVYCSTTGVYGVTGNTPAREDASQAPTNPYEASKLEGERLALRAYEEFGLPVSVARPGLVYGPGDLHLLGLFITIQRRLFRVIAGGSAILHPIYIDDLTAALLLCAEQPGAVGRCYNLAGERAVTMRELAESITRALDCKLPAGSIPLWLANLAADIFTLLPGLRGEQAPLTRSRVAFLTHSRVYDTSRARTELGFQPAMPLDEGLKRAARWYQKQGYF